MLCFNPVERQGTEGGTDYRFQSLGRIAMIPVFPGETVAQFCRTVFFRIPDKPDRADDVTGLFEYNNPGGGKSWPRRKRRKDRVSARLRWGSQRT